MGFYGNVLATGGKTLEEVYERLDSILSILKGDNLDSDVRLMALVEDLSKRVKALEDEIELCANLLESCLNQLITEGQMASWKDASEALLDPSLGISNRLAEVEKRLSAIEEKPSAEGAGEA